MRVALHTMKQPPTNTPNTYSRKASRLRRGRGFTLIEAALTTVIVGTGVLAIVAAQQAYTQKNDWAGKTGIAMNLANELRELTMPLPMHDPITGTAFMGAEPGESGVADYDDLDDFAGTIASGRGSGITFGDTENGADQPGPINALRQVVPDLDGWSQQIVVENVLPNDISSTFTADIGSTSMMRLTVYVRYQGPRDDSPKTITQTTWVVAR